MNRSDYKRLGDYIEPVDERNTNGEIKLSQGISNNKYFQTPKQVATDSTKDNIVRRGYFAYNRATTRNGEKISIAYREGEDCTVSGAYQVFRIKDESLLHPVYLWMWFRRPEFDRYARFKSHGSAHEFFEFDEMCEVMLPVPSIERQRAMVAEYETLSRRIDLNRSMIAQLEAMAQTLYRKMFVDDIDPEHLPAGWRMGTLGEICEINTENLSSRDKYQYIRYLDSSSVVQNAFEEYQTLNALVDDIPSRAKRKVRHNDIVYSTVRPNLKHYGIIKGDIDNLIVSTGFAVIRSRCEIFSNELIYLVLTDDKNTEILQGIAEMSKATYPSITPDDILNIKVLIPPSSERTRKINKFLKCCFDFIYFKHQENKEIKNLQSLLLAKMGQ